MTSNSQANSERRAGSIRLALDAIGNRTSATIASQGGGTFNYGNATSANQYTSITGRSAITHDANGNQLLNGAGAEFTWDSENRLLTVTPVSPSLGDKAQVHSYDGLHRRVTRTTREWTSSGWTNLETTYFIYDGWNVIEEWTRTFSPATTATLTRRLTWGQDLAGSPSLQGAGGVGGLLMVEEITSTTTAAYHFHYDGNGNVTEITDHLGAPAATYRYDAFGNTLVATGTYAATNRYRFSTKPLDSEVTTAPLYYYGYRYYDPLTGRWPSRDPIEERGGMNLYGFVRNDGINRSDALGLEAQLPTQPIFIYPYTTSLLEGGHVDGEPTKDQWEELYDIIRQLNEKEEDGKDCWSVSIKLNEPAQAKHVLSGIKNCDHVFLLAHGFSKDGKEFLELGDSIVSIGLLNAVGGKFKSPSICGLGCDVGDNKGKRVPQSNLLEQLIEKLRAMLQDCPCEKVCIYSGPVNSAQKGKKVYDQIGDLPKPVQDAIEKSSKEKK